MSQVGNNKNESQFAGPYYIQDHDHLGVQASGGRSRQVQQSQSAERQQGSGDHNTSGQHGGERTSKRKSR